MRNWPNQFEESHIDKMVLAEALIENASLNKATDLVMANRSLIELPESIGRLTNLRSLNLMGNRLTTLPETIGLLTQLEYLYLNDNHLVALPKTVTNLQSLKALYLHGNKLEMPAEILGPEWYRGSPTLPARILDYYFRTLKGLRPLNEAKLILVGRGAVGKTSIVNRLVDNRFTPHEGKTEGIQITNCQIMLHGHEKIQLNIWDFGGQEIMHATHQFFLTQRSLYLLVLNGRAGNEEADAEYWLKLIESFGGNSPVIVVLNKIHEHPFDLNRRALQKKYPNIKSLIQTDCADGTGIEELRAIIERTVDRLEDVRAGFPASWVSIKAELSCMKKNYLTFENYRELCTRHGEEDPSAQEALAGYLHDLGTILNYSGDPRLQDTHVLNPHWVTNGIYTILNSMRLAKQEGEIEISALPGMLDPVEYPVSMGRFIFDLMKKFELCFSFPDQETHYLIPELLDKQEPLAAAEFNPRECLNFQYHYSILPEGLLPRFIVRTHTLSEGLYRWRTGVIMQFERNKALVKADLQDNKVFISVKGPQAGRRRLLAVIRSDFERIHRDIRNLHPQEMVPIPGHPNVVIPYVKLSAMEQAGVRSFPEFTGTGVINLDVNELLNGVDLEGARRSEIITEGGRQAIRIFCSYSHKDEFSRKALEVHLKLLQRRRLIESWDDRKLEAGDDWKETISDNLDGADIVILLVSPDFIASDYCYELEMRRALERHETGAARVIPIIVRDVNLENTPLVHLQALPEDGLPITHWADKDSAWRNVSEGIEKVINPPRQDPDLSDDNY